MKKFIVKVSGFIFTAILLFIVFLFLLPPTPRFSRSSFFSAIKKDSLLLNEQSPRIIFVGGSNLGTGLNSQMIKDSLKLNPVNTAISALLGIRYMLENTLQYTQKEDIIVFIPEYQHFYWEWDYGSEVLLRTVLNTDKSKIRLLSLKQIINCIPFVGNFVFSQISKHKYSTMDDNDDVYGLKAYNQYGDSYLHWNTKKREFAPDTITIDKYNSKVIEEIKKYNQKFQEKGALLLISFPGYQDISFQNSEKFVKKVEQDYTMSGFTILGTAERYIMPDSLMFDSPYHLIGAGVNYRTGLLIEDLRKLIAYRKNKK
jgi:hypothetical protein